MSQSFPTPEQIQKRSARLSKRRAIILIGLYVLFMVHLVHWWIAGRTVAPAELNETMFTIEEGVVTIGTILLVLIMVSVLIFGRFFCSWGCHILALEDLASWILGKFGIRPKPVRSRLLPLAALGALLYMFVWPTVLRLYEGRAWPGLRVLTDEQGLGSFTTEQFTRNLPGPLMTTITFLVVGGAIVWLMGSRGFCRYVCPYGALFAGVDRISPAGIQLVGDCDGCGKCTPACTSHIRVHHEIQVHGRVVTPGCLKDLDCVMSCPRDALKFGYSKPPLLSSFDNFTKPDVSWAWTWPQEILGVFVCLGTLLATRQLYGEVPFLLAITLGVIAAWAAVTTLKLITNANLRVGRWKLKYHGEYKPASIGWVFLVTATFALLAHSGWIRWHEHQGQKAWVQVQRGDITQIEPMAEHLYIVVDYGLWRPPYADRMLADLWLGLGDHKRAIPHLEQLLIRWPENETRKKQLFNAKNAN
ncbi:MAG: 4Fe-4S binding protein [Phycisphaerales bacterium]|nr:4Fe-4S binding protein [Phycisphaerales bacterium]